MENHFHYYDCYSLDFTCETVNVFAYVAAWNEITTMSSVCMCISIRIAGEPINVLSVTVFICKSIDKMFIFRFHVIVNRTIEFIALCDNDDYDDNEPTTCTHLCEIAYFSVWVCNRRRKKNIENILLKLWQTFRLTLFAISVLCLPHFISSFEINIPNRVREFIRNAHACLHAYFSVLYVCYGCRSVRFNSHWDRHAHKHELMSVDVNVYRLWAHWMKDEDRKECKIERGIAESQIHTFHQRKIAQKCL